MGKASSAKKVARAARAGGSRRAGQRRPLGFPLALATVVILGTALVVFARTSRNANAEPKVGQHFHAAYSIYTCIAEPGTDQPGGTTTTTEPTDTSAPESGSSSTTTTAPGASSSSSSQSGLGLPPQGHLGVAQEPSSSPSSTDTTGTTATTGPGNTTTTTSTGPDLTGVAPSTTIPAVGDVPGQFLAPLQDASQDVLGIHTHGDGVIHIHPFASGVAGRKATLDKFFDQVGVTMTDDTLRLPTGQEFKEGTTKCEGGKDGTLQVAKWDNATDAAAGRKPNQVITSAFGGIRLQNREALTIAFLPLGSTIPVQRDISSRLDQLGDVDNSQVANQTGSSTTAVSVPPTAAPGSSDTIAPGASETTATTATTVPAN
jgi:hypothetical protein